MSTLDHSKNLNLIEDAPSDVALKDKKLLYD